jgi:hypothetical protein
MIAHSNPSIAGMAPLGRLYGVFMQRAPGSHRAFSQQPAIERTSITEVAVLDIILVLAGAGGILLMAAYAVACEHI